MLKKLSCLVLGLMCSISFASVVDISTPLQKKVLQIQVLDKEGASVAHSYASSIAWNADYMVSVAHLDLDVDTDVDKYSELKVRCPSDTLDVAFYKRGKNQQSESLDVEWEPIKNNRNVKAVGWANKGKDLLEVSGEVLPFMFKYEGQKSYKLMSGEVFKGMSGGPVFSEDGKAVGIIVGVFNDPLKLPKRPLQKYSVVLPEQSIQKAWVEVEGKIKRGECF